MTSSAKRGELQPPAQAGSTHRRQRAPQPTPGLDRVIQAQIGDKLRAMYGELSEQPVPERFASLLAQLGAPRRQDRS